MCDITKAILEKPRLWGWKEFINLRNFYEEVTNDPSNFLKDSNVPTIVHEDSDEMLISFNFGKKIESGNIFNRNNVNFNPQLYLESLH